MDSMAQQEECGICEYCNLNILKMLIFSAYKKNHFGVYYLLVTCERGREERKEGREGGRQEGLEDGRESSVSYFFPLYSPCH